MSDHPAVRFGEQSEVHGSLALGDMVEADLVAQDRLPGAR
jgi:hypothetical protein